MNRTCLIVVSSLLPAGTALADLPGTLNFRDVTDLQVSHDAEANLTNEKEVELGDWDEDGDLDVVIANAYSDFGARSNKIYENDGGLFTEVTDTAAPGLASARVSRNAFLRDFDGDGHLDIYIINDDNSHADQIFVADWTGGVFNGYSQEFGRIPNSGNTGAACSGWSADFDQDNDMDVYCGNYPNSSQDKLLLNDGSGFFTDVTSSHVPTAFDYVVDVNGADMNGDGNLDVLISNFGNNNNWVYYNNNLDAGSGVGDFKYTGSTQFIANPINSENAMEAADFDGDGDMDIYASNGSQASSTMDIIYRNDGNDAANEADLTMLNILPPSVTTVVSRKATAADLNDDGRVDVFVMKEAASNSRPTVLRNTSVNGEISFVDWSPPRAFPTGNVHKGWHARAFDADGDGALDIFLGGFVGDHFFENIPPAELNEGDLTGGLIPDVVDKSPAAVVGTGGAGEADVYVIDEFDSAFLSTVVNGADDYRLEILDPSDVVLATSDRGGLGIEEALQLDPAGSPASVKVRVTVLECGNGFNLVDDCGVGTTDFLELLANWGPNPGHPADFDGDGVVGTTDFLDLLANWGASDYIVEVLARTG